MVGSSKTCQTSPHKASAKTNFKDEIYLFRQDNTWGKTGYNSRGSFQKHLSCNTNICHQGKKDVTDIICTSAQTWEVLGVYGYTPVDGAAIYSQFYSLAKKKANYSPSHGSSPTLLQVLSFVGQQKLLARSAIILLYSYLDLNKQTKKLNNFKKCMSCQTSIENHKENIKTMQQKDELTNLRSQNQLWIKFSEQGNETNKVSFRCIKWNKADKRRH